MPKQAIKDGLKNILAEISKQGYEAVYVPKMNRDKCLWQSKSKAYTRIPFETLIDVMEFALENTLIKSLDGKIMKQTKGIPMGDPHSPGMCIGACAWMEKEWINTIEESKKKFFRFARYMDDVITVYAKNKTFNHNELLDSQQTECYTPNDPNGDGDTTRVGNEKSARDERDLDALLMRVESSDE